ncbi:MAG: hypothetical protein IJK67_01285 [Bacilli bacterium]|nr:hypothetical protein [Bacilli bacterium]
MTKELCKEAFLLVVSNYYNELCGDNVQLKDELDVTYCLTGMGVDLKLYYEKEIDGKLEKVYVSNSIIWPALWEFARKYEYDLKSFCYIGGVRRMGMFISEDEPYFEGVRLKVSDLNKERRLSLIKRDK